MVWKVEAECDPREGAHSWGKEDMVGDVTCLATHRCITVALSSSLGMLGFSNFE